MLNAKTYDVCMQRLCRKSCQCGIVSRSGTKSDMQALSHNWWTVTVLLLIIICGAAPPSPRAHLHDDMKYDGCSSLLHVSIFIKNMFVCEWWNLSTCFWVTDCLTSHILKMRNSHVAIVPAMTINNLGGAIQAALVPVQTAENRGKPCGRWSQRLFSNFRHQTVPVVFSNNMWHHSVPGDSS